MQKLHNVTIVCGDHAPFSTPVMGNKVASNGVTIPLSKSDAIDVAWARFFKHYLGIDFEGMTEGTTVRTSTGEIYLCNISGTTLKQVSHAYRKNLLGQCGYKVTVDTTTFVGLSASSVGKKRDANGKRIRTRKNSVKKQDTALKDTAVRTLPNGLKVA